jgi:hypothetical protein
MRRMERRRRWSRRSGHVPARAALLVGFVLIATCGCRRTPGEASLQEPAAKPPETSAVPPSPETTDRPAAARTPPQGGIWYVSSIRGARVGYERTAASEFRREGRDLVRVEWLSHMTVNREGVAIDLDVEFTSIETPEGQLLEFEGEISQGPVPMQMAGRVVGDELRIKTTTKGNTSTSSIPWSDEYGGFRAIEQSLSHRPMQPGQRRTIRALFPVFNVVGTTELIARQHEPVKLLTGTHELLRTDTTRTLPNAAPMRGSLWTDGMGEIRKEYLNAMDIETVRATRAEALEETGPVEIDLVRDVLVKVDRLLPSPHSTKRILYRVRIEGGDPAGVFVAGPWQQVKTLEADTAEVTVYAPRPGHPSGDTAAVDDSPGDEDLQPNNFIQSDDPAIVTKAREVAGDEQDPWRAAVALERATREVITRSGYSQAFASAAEVIESREGDCTEHAVLLAALCRARGIPARVAIGLVYVDQAFCYHMWTEVHVDGRWIGLDATRPQGGIGAAHLKMAHSNLKGASALSSFLPVLEVIGRLKIEILEVE